MNTSIQIGNITIHQSENGLYSLADLWKASGKLSRHNHNKFLKNIQTAGLIAEISSTQIRVLEKVHGGKNKGTYACKQLVYAYAMWQSPKFYVLVVNTFDALQNATTPQELQAVKDQLNWATGELRQMQARHPKDERTLSAILGLACSQAYPYFKHLVGIGELEQVRVHQPDKFIYRPTQQSKSVIGSNGDTLLFDSKIVKKLFPTQIDFVGFSGFEGVANG